jgi:hypothetical protein
LQNTAYVCQRCTSPAPFAVKLIPPSHESTASVNTPTTKHHAATERRLISTTANARLALNKAAAQHVTGPNDMESKNAISMEIVPIKNKAHSRKNQLDNYCNYHKIETVFSLIDYE